MTHVIINWAIAVVAVIAFAAAQQLDPHDFETEVESEMRVYTEAAQACRNAHRTESAPEWDDTNQRWVCVTRRGEVLAYQQPGAMP